VQRPRERPLAIALGIWLACRGVLAPVAMGMAALGALGAVGYCLFARRADVTHVPTRATVAIAWSAGVMLAFGSCLRAIVRDWEDGIVALARVRGVRSSRYMRGRIAGVVVVLAVTLGSASLATGLAATAVAKAPLATARDGLAAILYALVFAATLGPVAVAALGARSRVRGYLRFFAVLVLPELIAPWTAEALPSGWQELTSIPAALFAVLRGVEAPSLPAELEMARAIAGLAAIVAISAALVQARTPRVSRAPGDAA
jgi:hypothetical protein